MALSDYQIQLPDGAIVGAGQPVGLLETTGLRDLANLRSADVDAGQADGSVPGLSYATKRAVQFKFLIASPGGGAEAAYAPLSRNWQNIRDPSTVVLTAGSYLSQLAAGGTRPVSGVQVQLPGRAAPVLLLGRPSKLGLPVDRTYQFGWWEIAAEWSVPDGLIYGAVPNIATAYGMQVSKGAPFPWVFPVVFPPSTGGTVTAINAGSYPAKPVYRITGPVTTPRISNPATGQAIQINLTIGPGDLLIVDTASRAVRLNGVNRNNALDVGSSFFDVAPGGAALRYSSSDSNPTGSQLSIYTLDTYSTL